MAFHSATLISLGVAVAASIGTALVVSALVSARVVRPVRGLAAAAQRIAGGSPTARVPVRGTDELAQLATAFNEMAASLEHAETVRRQLLADVAHELRTPLATVESYVEALSDGVLSPDAENWGAIRSETARLGRLVDDLQRVSRAEANQLELHRSAFDPGQRGAWSRCDLHRQPTDPPLTAGVGRADSSTRVASRLTRGVIWLSTSSPRAVAAIADASGGPMADQGGREAVGSVIYLAPACSRGQSSRSRACWERTQAL